MKSNGRQKKISLIEKLVKKNYIIFKNKLFFYVQKLTICLVNIYMDEKELLTSFRKLFFNTFIDFI